MYHQPKGQLRSHELLPQVKPQNSSPNKERSILYAEFFELERERGERFRTRSPIKLPSYCDSAGEKKGNMRNNKYITALSRMTKERDD